MHTQQEQHTFSYVKAILAGVAIIFLITATITLMNNPFGKGDVPAMITISGKGEVMAVPDVSRFTVLVSEKATTQSDALAKTSEKMNAVMSGLKDLGIQEKDIKTESVNTYPNYEYVRATGEQKLAGWVSTNTLSIKVRTLEIVPQVQQLFADQKVTNVSGPDLSIDDTDALKLNARNLAILDAQDQAKVLAEQLGVRLGKIVSFNESNNDGAMYDYARNSGVMGMSMKESAPQIATGEQKITSQVSVTYRIK